MAQRGLTVKQRRFVKHYVETGNGTQAALVAYGTDDPATAHAIAAENLQKPAIQQAVSELLEAGGLSDRKLTEIHAHYLALYRSPDPREKALGLKALDMAYRLTGAYAPERHRLEVDAVIEAMSAEELAIFVESGVLPEWLLHRPWQRPSATLTGGRAAGQPPIDITPAAANPREGGDATVLRIGAMQVSVRTVPKTGRALEE